MTNEELFAIWAPDVAIWSPWAKPVLFAQREAKSDGPPGYEEWVNVDAGWAPPAGGRVAVVIDLPGESSALVGLALAAKGYRPVPLYNACCGPSAVVPVERIVQRLVQGTPYLQRLELPADAPPAFLLDADRLKGTVSPAPGQFDNRWVTLPQDFPSASFLQSHTIQSVVLVQSQSGQPAEDLAHVLLRWQEAGIPLRVVRPTAGSQPQILEVRRPRFFRWAWQRALAAFGLRRNSAGGFGAVVPEASAG